MIQNPIEGSPKERSGHCLPVTESVSALWCSLISTEEVSTYLNHELILKVFVNNCTSQMVKGVRFICLHLSVLKRASVKGRQYRF